jgi:hypothetical protein
MIRRAFFRAAASVAALLGPLAAGRRRGRPTGRRCVVCDAPATLAVCDGFQDPSGWLRCYAEDRHFVCDRHARPRLVRMVDGRILFQYRDPSGGGWAEVSPNLLRPAPCQAQESPP